MKANGLIESTFRTFMFISGILGNNWLAIVSFPRKKSDIRTSEILFINLAVSNLITNYLVDIPDTMVGFAGQWFLGATFCGIFRFSSDFSETSSLFTTLFICAYWHQKLVGSLKRGGAPVQLDNLRLVGCLLALSWALSIVFSFPRLIYVSVVGTNGSHEDCIDVLPDAISRETFDIVFLTLANALPVAGIMVASIQIVATLLQNHKRIQSHSSDPAKGKVKEDDPEKSVCTVSIPHSCKDLNEPSVTGRIPQSSPSASKTDCKPNLLRPNQIRSETHISSSPVRAAKSVLAVATVVLICWMTHLFVRISNNIHPSSLMMKLASNIGASYICIIPYIFLHGVKKLCCSYK